VTNGGIIVLGDIMNYKRAYKYRDENYYIHHTISSKPAPEDFAFKSHSHNMYEVYYFLGGEADLAVEGKVYSLKKGTIVITDRGQTHNIIIKSSETPYERIAILFSAKVLTPSFLPLFDAAREGKNCYFLNEDEQIWFYQSIKTIENSENSKIDAKTIISVAVSSILAKLGTMLTISNNVRNEENDLVREIIKFINNNIEMDWTLDTLEKSLFRDKAYLNRKFKSVMGCSIWEYNLRKRIFSAQQQLYLSQSVNEAYLASGFNDYSSFYRRYKKYIGLSPTDDLRSFNLK